MRTRLYTIWGNMMQRCDNPNRPDFRYYGGKGVQVCAAWRKYRGFESWAAANGYQDDLTLDRINPAGDYSPANCRWIPFAQQRQNTTQTVWVTIDGRTNYLKAWSRELGINYSTVTERTRRGMTPIQALLTPPLR